MSLVLRVVVVARRRRASSATRNLDAPHWVILHSHVPPRPSPYSIPHFMPGFLEQRRVVLYPYLFAAYAVLRLANWNAQEVAPSDLAEVLGAVLVLVALLELVLTLLFRPRYTPRGVAAITAVAVGNMFLIFPLVGALFSALPRPIVVEATLAVWAVLCTTAVWRVIRSGTTTAGTARFFNVAGTILCVFALGTYLYGLRDDHLYETNPVVQAIRTPFSIRPGAGVPHPLPDVYVVVLDGYASERTLRRMYHVDNRPFLDSLRGLGFMVPRSRSNYPQTLLSVPSLLNGRQVSVLATTLDHPHQAIPTLRYLVENNATLGFLKPLGYRFVFFPSPWWNTTAHNRNADAEVLPKRSVAFLLWRTEFRQRFIATTLFRPLLARWVGGPEMIRTAFHGLAELPMDRRPVFVVAHVLAPHTPFVMHDDCTTVHELRLNTSVAWVHRDQYAAQLACVNAMVLRTVTTILAKSETPPVIILTGDHGAASLMQMNYHSGSQLSREQIQERFETFTAIDLPPGDMSAVPDTITLVNVLPTVLRAVFAADAPHSPDRHFYAPNGHPLTMTEVEVE